MDGLQPAPVLFLPFFFFRVGILNLDLNSCKFIISFYLRKEPAAEIVAVQKVARLLVSIRILYHEFFIDTAQLT